MDLNIKTARLRLRPPQESDVFLLAELCGQPDIARMTTLVPCPYPPQAAAGWVAMQWGARRQGSAFQFIIEDDSRPVVGGIGVFRRTVDAGWEIGYWIATDRQRRGYAAEALAAAIVWGREELGVPYFIASYFEDNPISGRILERAGFQPTGTMTDAYSLAREGKARCVDMVLPPEGMTTAPTSTDAALSA